MHYTKTRRRFLTTVGAAAGFAVGVPGARAGAETKRFIVDTRDGFPDGVARSDVDVVYPLDGIDAMVVRAPASAAESPDVTRDLRIDLPPTVASQMEPTRTASGSDTGATGGGTGRADLGDPYTEPFQWNVRDQGLLKAHGRTRGERTRVAVIDSGVFRDHWDLVGQVNTRLSRNFTDDGGSSEPVGDNAHGTLVAGVISAMDNGTGYVGVAPETDLVDLRVFSGEEALVGDVVAAIVYAADVGCDVANLSLGAYPVPLDDPEGSLIALAFELAANYALRKGTLPVAAAGNDGTNLDEDPPNVLSVPAELPGYLSVSATGPIGFRWDDGEDVTDPYDALREPTTTPAFYTNFGREAVDLSAPGGNVDQEAIETEENAFLDLVPAPGFTTVEGSPVPVSGWVAGTSFAVPHVSGAAALVSSLVPSWRPRQVRSVLERAAKDIPPRRFRGAGHLDTRTAVRRAANWEAGRSETAQQSSVR